MNIYKIIINAIFIFTVTIFVGCATSSVEKKAVSKDAIVEQVQAALEQYFVQYSEYPKSLSQLQLSKEQEHLKSHLSTLKYKSYKWRNSAGYDLETESHARSLKD